MGLYRTYELNLSFRKNFKISFETDDIVDFSSYEKGKEIIKKYGIKF